MNTQTVTLALYPNTRGFGYACLESTRKLIDWGIMNCRPISNQKIVKQVVSMLEYFRPQIVLIQDPNNLRARQNRRVAELVEHITRLAEEKNITVFSYTREQVRDIFSHFQATTKHEIATKLIEWFPELSPRVPKARKLWMNEDYNMGIFDALSLAIAHAYLTE